MASVDLAPSDLHARPNLHHAHSAPALAGAGQPPRRQRGARSRKLPTAPEKAAPAVAPGFGRSVSAAAVLGCEGGSDGEADGAGLGGLPRIDSMGHLSGLDAFFSGDECSGDLLGPLEGPLTFGLRKSDSLADLLAGGC
jgi:hypothetical protein